MPKRQVRYQEWTFLRRARIRARLTPTRMADASRVSLTFYCQVEKGRRGVSDDVLNRFADALAVDVIDLDETRPTIPPRRSNSPTKTGARDGATAGAA